jgi:hypothetical protein
MIEDVIGRAKKVEKRERQVAKALDAVNAVVSGSPLVARKNQKATFASPLIRPSGTFCAPGVSVEKEEGR